jgi:hypothetical protein
MPPMNDNATSMVTPLMHEESAGDRDLVRNACNATKSPNVARRFGISGGVASKAPSLAASQV